MSHDENGTYRSGKAGASYDLIVSLGGNCAVAQQLVWRNKRPFSLGLDWLSMPDEKPVRFLVKAFGNKFSDFALRENLQDVTDVVPKKNPSLIIYFDRASGFHFLHQFSLRQNDPDWYDKDASKLKMRIDRMFSAVAQCQRVLFILATSFSYEEGLADGLVRAVRAAFPSVTCDFRMMMFNAGKDEECLREDFEVVRIKRPIHRYDLYATSAVWAFLDDIEVTSCQYPALKGLNRLCYRLWKHLGKKVKRCGVKTDFVFR